MNKFNKKNIEDILPLTPMQEGMLFHYLKDPGSDINFEQLSLEISGEINKEIFEKAWNLVIETNEMLRTVFRWEKVDNPIQVILKKHYLQPEYYDLSKEKDNEKKKPVEKIKIQDRKEKFDLREVPFRVKLYKIEEDRYEMIISNHHILYDGWSSSIILEEFIGVYTHLWRGNKTWEIPVKTKFKNFVQWLQSQDNQSQRTFWQEYLRDSNCHRNNKESDKKRKRKRGEIACSGDYGIQLPGRVTDQLERFVKEHHITMASLFYCVWGVLLQHYNYSNDVLFDTTVSGRNPGCLKGIEDMVGLFIKTLPLRINIYPGEKIGDFLTRMNRMLERWGKFSNSSLFMINEYRGEGWGQNLFDSILVIENYPLGRILKQENRKPDAPISVRSFSISENANYDITVIVTPFDDIKVNFTYNKNLFNKDSLLRLTDHFTHILEEILNHPAKFLEKVALEMPGKIKRDIEILKENKVIDPGKTIGFQTLDNTPADVIEEELLRIWEEELGKKPDPGDNFFDISGDSIALVRIYKKINQRYPGKIKVNDFFRTPTIRGLRKLLTSPNKETLPKTKERKNIRNINF